MKEEKRMASIHIGKIVQGSQAEDCVVCGEEVRVLESQGSSLLCESCLETADLPMSAYYLTQYYYRFAD
jgi:hypothetical protein